VSISGRSSRSGARIRSASVSPPSTAPSTATRLRPRIISGSSGSGGSRSTRSEVVTSSGAAAAQSRQRRSTGSSSVASQASSPAYAVAIGNSANSSAVTTPKLPPPPRSAQNRSGSWPASARTRLPSAVTSSIAVTLLVCRPCLRAYQPMPPPSE
jgi:hypothetical protein